MPALYRGPATSSPALQAGPGVGAMMSRVPDDTLKKQRGNLFLVLGFLQSGTQAHGCHI